MKRMVMAILIAAAITGCDKQIGKESELQENTEEYFKAHGIVQGQPNELRIGGTLFRFPAGVGLNPHSAQGAIRWIDESPGAIRTLSSKECLEQGKCEEVTTPIVKGQADYVYAYLKTNRLFSPISDPFGWQPPGDANSSTGITIIISGGAYREDLSEDGATVIARKSAVQSLDNNAPDGLREFIFDGGKNPGDRALFYLATDVRTPRGGPLILRCDSRFDAKKGYVNEPAVCSVIYQAEEGFSVSYSFSGTLLPRWQEVHHAVASFVNSAVVK